MPCRRDIKARYWPGVRDVATNSCSFEYTLQPPRTGANHTHTHTVPFTVQSRHTQLCWHCVCVWRLSKATAVYMRNYVSVATSRSKANNVPQARRQGVNVLIARRSCHEANSDMFSDISNDGISCCRLSVCVYVCLSVTSRYCIKTAT